MKKNVFLFLLLMFLGGNHPVNAATWEGCHNCLPELTQKKNFLPQDMTDGYKGIPEYSFKKNVLSNTGDTMKAPANYPDSPAPGSSAGSTSSSAGK